MRTFISSRMQCFRQNSADQQTSQCIFKLFDIVRLETCASVQCGNNVRENDRGSLIVGTHGIDMIEGKKDICVWCVWCLAPA